MKRDPINNLLAYGALLCFYIHALVFTRCIQTEGRLGRQNQRINHKREYFSYTLPTEREETITLFPPGNSLTRQDEPKESKSRQSKAKSKGT